MRLGAQNLLESYHGAKTEVAEAYVRGEITGWRTQFIWDVIDEKDVIAARSRLPQTTWSLIERVAELEKQIVKLQREESDDSI